MLKLIVGSASLLVLAIACQKHEKNDSATKNVFTNLEQNISEIALTDSEVIGGVAFFSNGPLEPIAYALQLNVDGTGTVSSDVGSSSATWKIQRGRLIVNIADLKGPDYASELSSTRSDKQYVITKRSVNGNISFALNIMSVITTDDGSKPPKFTEFGSGNLELASLNKISMDQYMADGDKVSIELDYTHAVRGVVSGQQIISMDDGASISFEPGSNAKFAIDGSRYEISALKSFGDNLYTLAKLTSPEGVVTVVRGLLVRESFNQVLTVPMMAGIYKSGDNAVYNFRSDGIMEMIFDETSIIMTWEITGANSFVAKRWTRTVNDQPEYFLSADDSKLCANDPAANKCYVRYSREFTALSLTSDAFYLLRKIYYNNQTEDGKDQFELSAVNNFKLEPLGK